MRRPRAALAAMLPLFWLLSATLPACSGALTQEGASRSATRPAPEEKGEILSEDFDREPSWDEDETTADKAGGLLVAVTFVGVVLAAALLPLLLFL